MGCLAGGTVSALRGPGEAWSSILMGIRVFHASFHGRPRDGAN